MDDGTLVDANKAKAAPIKSRNLGDLGKTAFLKKPNKVEKWEARYSSQHLQTLSLACPLWTVVRNRSKLDNSTVNVTYIRAKEFLLIT
jgi:hypothetical protein